jgi:NAD(P)-dependent dehydrogenase (short-subunit alcohol dehydrogenase family)
MAREARSLPGQVAAVTGGARGIGRATATALARSGLTVAIGDLDGGLAAEAAAAIGRDAVGLELDVTSEASFSGFLDEVERRLGPLDVLVNNAGIMAIGPFLEETEDTAARQVDINLLGVIRGSKLAVSRFRTRGRGHLVNVASSAGKYGAPGGATYSATKFGVVGLSEAIRAEHGDDGIDVSVVMPGVVRTELATGLQDTRGVKVSAPEDVAQAIVEALQHPRFDVFVPKSAGRILWFTQLLPRRGRELIGRAVKADRTLAAADFGARKNYELRAAQSAPHLESGSGSSD